MKVLEQALLWLDADTTRFWILAWGTFCLCALQCLRPVGGTLDLARAVVGPQRAQCPGRQRARVDRAAGAFADTRGPQVQLFELWKAF